MHKNTNNINNNLAMEKQQYKSTANIAMQTKTSESITSMQRNTIMPYTTKYKRIQNNSKHSNANKSIKINTTT